MIGAPLQAALTTAFGYALCVMRQAPALQPGIEVIARCEGAERLQTMHEMGVETVVWPELEAGLEMARQALVRCKRRPRK